MFDKIQHIGYLVDDLDAAVAWYRDNFGGENAGGSSLNPSVAVPSGGRNAFVHFGQVEVEIIEPNDKAGLWPWRPHHAPRRLRRRRYRRRPRPTWKPAASASPPSGAFTNVLGQGVLYFDPATTNGCLMHLTQQPEVPNATGVGQGVDVQRIVHAGYQVPNLEDAVAWYQESFDGVHVGGGASRRGGRNAFVNFGQVQVELIEPGDPASLGGAISMDHVGYVVNDIAAGIDECCSRGFQFIADAPNTNSIGQQVLYFDTACTCDSRMHLTQLPPD